MNSVRKIISALLCAVILLGTLCSCDLLDLSIGNPQNKDEPFNGLDEVGYTVAYLRTDSLNPYKCESDTNRNIVRLMFDPLFNVTDEFEPIAVIAESYSYTQKNVIDVKLKAGLTFSDGTALTAQDVVYSFVLAKRNNYYSQYLKNVVDCSANGSENAVFTLREENPYEVSNLSFPIIKNGSDQDTSSSDDYSSAIPIGSGRYTFVEENETKKLVANKTRLGSYTPQYNYIGLRDITETSSIPSLFDLNEVDFYTESFSDGAYKRYTGTSTTFETSNFVYLGINSQSNLLKHELVRRAIALLIDRKNVAAVSFSDFAVATTTPFHPSFYATEGCSVMPSAYNENAAEELLDEVGFTVPDNNYGTRYSPIYGKLELRLLVNKENSFKLALARNIQQTLAKANINVILREYTYAQYVNAVEEGYYDLYIGEVNLSNSFNLNSFFSSNGSVSYGIDSECNSAKDYKLLLKGEKNMQEFIDTFTDELPFIPLVYRQGITVRSSKIKTDSKTIVSDYLYNIDEWTVE